MKNLLVSLLVVGIVAGTTAADEEIDIKTLVKQIEDLKQKVSALEDKVKSCNCDKNYKRYLLSENVMSSPVAFSAYVSDYQYGLGLHQLIRFDKVILNDGNGYNNHTGVFTSPVSGVYAVSFFIADRNVNQVMVQLQVDNVGVYAACAETIQSTHIDQGGNMALVTIKKGQCMWVETKYGSSSIHIESHSGYPFTTFSAFLLYEI